MTAGRTPNEIWPAGVNVVGKEHPQFHELVASQEWKHIIDGLTQLGMTPCLLIWGFDPATGEIDHFAFGDRR